MKRRLLISVEIAVILLAVLAVNWSFGLLNAPSDRSVAEGLLVVLAIFVVVPSVILLVRDQLHHPKN